MGTHKPPTHPLTILLLFNFTARILLTKPMSYKDACVYCMRV